MRKLWTDVMVIFGCVLIVTIFNSCDATQPSEKMADGLADHQARIEALKEANNQFYAGLNAMFEGDLKPLTDLWSHGNDITQMGPFGGRITGWDDVYEEFSKQAAMKFGGKIVCKDLHVYAGKDVGYTICIEHGENMSTDGNPIEVSHRATNIFHLQDGKWRLVHHHTDIAPQLDKAYYDKESKQN